ncbi:MAG: PmoA family protein [Planctomycetales bacterium]|nr:PmoA family protein [Planctomycetales bacterium]
MNWAKARLSTVYWCAALLGLLMVQSGDERIALAQEPVEARDATEARSAEAPLFVLAGDSTVTDEAGWGRGFAELLEGEARCVNHARGGESSRSFRTRGLWQRCLEARPDYLLIQFGHNDQPGKGPERESSAAVEFPDHLRRFVAEARDIGAEPILITSLTRRRWSDVGKIEPTLADYAEATLRVAQELDVTVLDLHAASIEQCEQMGPTEFRALEPMTAQGADHTHLNIEGGSAVGSLVAQLLLEQRPDLAPFFSPSRIQAANQPRTVDRSLSSGALSLEVNDQVVRVSHDQQTMLEYLVSEPPAPDGIDSIYRRSGLLHPVCSPNGRTVTGLFPVDHPHQHGVFTAWVNTTWNDRSIDFWNLAKGEGRVLHQRIVDTFVADDRIGFSVDLVHRAQQAPIVDVLRERWTITAYPVRDDAFEFDLELTQTAITELPLRIHRYHYGGVAVRGPDAWLLPTDGDPRSDESRLEPSTLTNEQGSERIAGNHEPTRWVVLQGELGGHPVALTVLGHVDNFRAPQPARLHPTKPYFAWAPCVIDEFEIDQAHPYHARYKFLVTDAEPSPDWIERRWREWCDGRGE